MPFLHLYSQRVTFASSEVYKKTAVDIANERGHPALGEFIATFRKRQIETIVAEIHAGTPRLRYVFFLSLSVW